MKKNIFISILIIVICVLSYKLYILNDEYLTLDSIYQTTQTRLIVSNKKISDLNDKIFNYEKQIKFMDDHVAICTTDGPRLYHKYSCDKLDTSSFLIFNIEQAPNEGFQKCHLCADLDNTKDSTSRIVYVTDTGNKYHQSGCSYISKNPITIEKAISQGYGACFRCNPIKGQ